MDTLYLLLKFAHVLAVAVWIGGVIAFGILNVRLARRWCDCECCPGDAERIFWMQRARADDGDHLPRRSGHDRCGRLSLQHPWIACGIVGLVLSVAMGVLAVGRPAGELSTLARRVAPDDPRLYGPRRRLIALNALNLLLLSSIVWAMVLEPTL